MKLLINTSLLRTNSNYRYLYLGQFVSFVGTMITSVALPYQIYQMTKSVLLIGLLSLCQLIPILVTALLGGVFADRYHRRNLLIISEILLAIGSLILLFNATLQQPKICVIFLTASVMSAVNGFHRPTLTSLNQQLVKKSDYAAVGSLRTLMSSFSMMAGPAIGGLIISGFGLVASFGVDVISFLISLCAILAIKNIPEPSKRLKESIWISLKSGIRYAFSRQELIGTYAVDFVAMLFGMPLALFPAIAQNYGGAKVLGFFYSAPAVGSFITSCLSGWVALVKHHGRAVAIASALFGVAIICFGLVKNLWLALFFLSLSGAFDTINSIFRQMIWNETITNKLRGRLAGIELISYLSGPKLGDTEAGLVATAFGITASIVSGGILCVLGVILCCYKLPKFWNYNRQRNAIN